MDHRSDRVARGSCHIHAIFPASFSPTLARDSSDDQLAREYESARPHLPTPGSTLPDCHWLESACPATRPGSCAASALATTGYHRHVRSLCSRILSCPSAYQNLEIASRFKRTVSISVVRYDLLKAVGRIVLSQLIFQTDVLSS